MARIGGGHRAEQGGGEVLAQGDPTTWPGVKPIAFALEMCPQMARSGCRSPRAASPAASSAQSEQAEDLAEQPVVALGLRAGLLPGGDLPDRAGAQHGHRTLHGVVGVAGPSAAGPITWPPGSATAAGGAHTRPGCSPGR